MRETAAPVRACRSAYRNRCSALVPSSLRARTPQAAKRGALEPADACRPSERRGSRLPALHSNGCKAGARVGALAAGGHRSGHTETRCQGALLRAGDTADAGEQGARALEPARASGNASVTVAARRGLVLSSARHAGENSSMESPKAQPPEPLRQKDRVRSKSLESGTGARRRRIHRRGTPSSAVTSHTYMSADATRSRENLSGKRTDGACSVTNRTRPFLVHPDGAPSR